MHVLVTGSSGLIGSALVPFLTGAGHRVTRAVRSESDARSDTVRWNPTTGALDTSELEGLDAVVHLAGENVAGRWTTDKKQRIRDSRIKGTRLLCDALAELDEPPAVLACASGVGFYGDRGTERLTEESSSGVGFLADVCREWEGATIRAGEKGIRVVHLRIGMVLASTGGALAKMLTPFRLGLGGRIGSGRQCVSWIALDDVIGAVLHALTTDSLRGPVNVVAPQPVTNREFARTFGRVLGRPAVLPLPAFAARLAFGEMADALLLGGARVAPVRLVETGYSFRFADLEATLRWLLRRT